jgi:hypothetical protein
LVVSGTLPKPLINTACQRRPVWFRSPSLTFRDRKPTSTGVWRTNNPINNLFVAACCLLLFLCISHLAIRHPQHLVRPIALGDLVSVVYHCPRRPRAGHNSALHLPPSISLCLVRDYLSSSSMSSPPHAYQPSTPHIRLNSGSDDLANMADNQYDHAVRPQPSSRSLTRPGTAGSASVRPSLHPAPSSNSMYNAGAPESAELLLPPSRSRPSRRFRDDDSPMRSPSQSGYNSRRTSWGSESTGSRDSRAGPFASPFDDSRAPSRAGSDDEGVNTQTVSEKYNILPSAGLLLFPEDVEKDDYLHNPDPNEKEGRITCSDLFSKRGITNLGGLVLITLGVFMLFIGYPIMYVLCCMKSCHPVH